VSGPRPRSIIAVSLHGDMRLHCGGQLQYCHRRCDVMGAGSV